MSVNLRKNKAALEKAWEEIHDPNGKNDWVVFGYEGQSTDLKIVSQGEDGIDEMVDDLSGGKILYAGLRVTDPNTNLPKIVFINWQGEGVPGNIKGKCANHLRDITNFFKGVHVQINARSEDDVEEKNIIEKVKSSSGANYSFHKEKPKAFIPQGNVGSVYQKSRPDQDINVREKDQFWAQKEREEKLRKEEDAKHLQEERIKESRERAEREKKEAAARDTLVRERAHSIDEQKKHADVELQRRKEEEKRKYQESLQEAEKDDAEFRKRSDSDRRKRLQEANQLIRKRQESFGESSPRETFEKQPVSPPPITAPKKKALPPPPATKNRRLPPEHAVFDEPVPVRQPSPEPDREPSPEPIREPSPEPIREPSPEPVREPSPEPVPEPTPVPIEDPAPMTKGLPAEPTMTLSDGLTARAIYDYQAADETEITFNPGDVITAIEQIDDGWWRGYAPNGHYGLFPANYVELIDSSAVASATPITSTEERAPDAGVSARALYDYQAVDDTEITFDPDDIITAIDMIDEGWWRGTGPDGRIGLFPANYVELLS